MNPSLSPTRARELVERMVGCRILVLGDLMVDRFLWGSVNRISPEAPVPVVHLASETAALGGAGNVARNLKALGARADLVGAVGRDRGAEDFWRLLKDGGMDGQGVVAFPDRATTVKTRVIAHHQQVVRIDRETHEPLGREELELICGRAMERVREARALLISDYDKGVVAPELLQRLLPVAREVGLPVTIDPKPPNCEHYRHATVVTPNLHEARIMAGARSGTEEQILRMGSTLREHLQCKAVLLTRGEEGMTLFQEALDPVRIPASAREVFDVTGAGDTVIAVLTLALVAGASVAEASILANHAAGLVVGKLGTAVVSSEELANFPG